MAAGRPGIARRWGLAQAPWVRWCAQPESNRHGRNGREIFLPLRLSPPRRPARSWSGLCLGPGLAGCQALGPRRQVSARPGPTAGPVSLSVASPGRAGGSLNLTGFTRRLSHPGAQINGSKSLVSTNSTMGAVKTPCILAGGGVTKVLSSAVISIGSGNLGGGGYEFEQGGRLPVGWRWLCSQFCSALTPFRA